MTHPLPVEVRPLKISDIPAALELHYSVWGRNPDVIDENILKHLVQNHGNYQLGLFIRGKLAASIATAQAKVGRVSSSIELKKHDEIARNYQDIRSGRVRGNARACFIVTRDMQLDREEKKLFREKVAEWFPEMSPEQVQKVNPAHVLVNFVKEQALKDPKVLYLTAATTAENLRENNATFDEIQRAIPESRNVNVLHNRARVWKIIPNGRPNAPFGGNSLIYVHYPLGKWQTVLKELFEGLRPHGVRVADQRSRRVLKKHGIAINRPIPSSRSQQREKNRFVVEASSRKIGIHKIRPDKIELIHQIVQEILDRAESMHGIKAVVRRPGPNHISIEFQKAA